MNVIARTLGSVRLAFGIVRGGLRMVRQYPKLVAPLVPVFLMVLGLEFGLLFLENLFLELLLVFIVAFELMFSFALTSKMIYQIHEGREPSLGLAISSRSTLRMIPRIFLISLVWYSLIIVLVLIEIAINAFLDDKDGGSLINAVFGTLADALRLMGFMLIPIMTFEDLGFSASLRRMRAILTESPISALSGLALTKLATLAIFLLLEGVSQLGLLNSFAGFILFLVVIGGGWILAIFLEQIFVTGLFLYAAYPESSVVGILLQDHLGRELPAVPAPQAAGLTVSS